jgi:alpha-D-xyloside xylohydrolase
MGVFTHGDQALEWRGGQEIVRIEPWGPGSLRVRGTVWEKIRDDLPSALIPVKLAPVKLAPVKLAPAKLAPVKLAP